MDSFATIHAYHPQSPKFHPESGAIPEKNLGIGQLMQFAARFLGRPGPSGFSADMLESFLRAKVEEGLNLDYKHIAAVENPDKLAQAVTAFANAEGGLIILGVEEEPERDESGQTVRIWPGRITWGDKSLAREKVETILVTRTHPPIPGLRIHPVRNESGQPVFLVDVPQSPRPPHQAPDKRYYLRYNFQNLQMDHYQVEALFHKRLRPALRPVLQVIRIGKDGKEVDLRLGLENEGGAIGKQPLLYLELQNCMDVTDIEKKFFLSVEPDETTDRAFRVHFHSPIQVVHPRMISYAGSVHLSLGGAIGMTILVGAEEMSTRQYWCGLAPSFLVNVKHDFSKGPYALRAMSYEDEFDQDAFKEVLTQVGVDPEKFLDALHRALMLQDADGLKKLLEDIDRNS